MSSHVYQTKKVSMIFVSSPNTNLNVIIINFMIIGITIIDIIISPYII